MGPLVFILSLCLSLCPVWSHNSKINMNEKTGIDENRLWVGSNQCAIVNQYCQKGKWLQSTTQYIGAAGQM